MNPFPTIFRASSIAPSLLTTLFVGTANLAFAEDATFSVNFRTGVWDHSAVGGSASSTGWGVNGATGRGYTQGSTFFSEANLSLTVQSLFLGSAAPGADNFRIDPINTPGFAFQNAGTGDKNTTSLLNYQRIDFSFSSPVTMDFLELRDIDTASSSGTQAWRDATGLELWDSSPPVSWEVLDGVTKKALHRGSQTFTEALSEEGYDGVVAAESRLVGQLADAISAMIRE